MRVRILSGSLVGQVIEQDRSEAESNIAMGFAEVAPEPVAVKVEQKPAKRQEKPLAEK